MSKKPTGIILYKGPSQIDGKKIVAIATNIFTKGTDNEKIGDMIQIWIMRPDVPPGMACKTDEDFSICGDCKHRDFNSCYVQMLRGPCSVYRAYHNDRYIRYKDKPELVNYFKFKPIRIGAYGDPVAVPLAIWENLITNYTIAHASYTHQWRKCDQRFKRFCMASVDNVAEYEKAQSMGWRTFRIRVPNETEIFDDNEFICPASKEGGEKTSCSRCCACCGNIKNIKSITSIIHGQEYKVDNFIKGIKKIKNKKRWRMTKQEKIKRLEKILI